MLASVKGLLSVLAIVGGQASPGFGLGVLVTSRLPKNTQKADFQTSPGHQGRHLLEHQASRELMATGVHCGGENENVWRGSWVSGHMTGVSTSPNNGSVLQMPAAALINLTMPRPTLPCKGGKSQIQDILPQATRT